MSIDDIYLFLSNYGKDKTLNSILVLLKNGNSEDVKFNNYFRIYL